MGQRVTSVKGVDIPFVSVLRDATPATVPREMFSFQVMSVFVVSMFDFQKSSTMSKLIPM